MKLEPVCKNCQDRFDGCHSSCKRYLNAKREYDEKKQRNLDQCVNGYIASMGRKFSKFRH